MVLNGPDLTTKQGSVFVAGPALFFARNDPLSLACEESPPHDCTQL
jgi:hypothetical protein